MSSTSFAVNDSMAVKLWSMEVAEAERETLDISNLMGEDDDSIIQIKNDFSKTKTKGDSITYALRVRMGGKGFTEGQTAWGNARALTFYSDALLINELGQTVGVKSDATIDAQRVPMNLREQGKSALVEWWKDRKAIQFHNQAGGYTPANTESDTSGTVFAGFNTVVAPSSTRKIFAGAAAADESLTSSDTFTVSLIDKAKEIASTGDNIVRPSPVGGQKKYVMYLDPAQVTSLRTNSTSGGWQDITKYAYSGLNPSDHPLYKGSLGEWNGVILRQSQDVTQGVNSSSGAAITTVRRAVLLGCQAVVAGFGGANKYGPMKYRWSEELFDHGRQLELGAWSIMGIKKTIFNSVDYGVVTVSTYAVRQS